MEPTFDELEALMYEVRNARRGSYAGFGDKVSDLVDELTSLSVQLRNDADRLDYTEDELNETIDENCSDKKVENNEEADNARDEFVNQLKETLTKASQLEKDNLSLQEQLSVCNAKEIKLKEELSRYKKAAANLSDSVKDHYKLREDLEATSKLLKEKDMLLESNKKSVRAYRARLNEATNSKATINKLNENVNSLKEQLSTKDNELAKVTKLAKRLKSALKESRNAYVKAQAIAYGINEAELRSRLKESYSLNDVDSICEALSEQKLNLSKLPFRLNENTRINFKASTNEYIRGNNYLDDDAISENLLRMLDN